jgi:hypothetical protein
MSGLGAIIVYAERVVTTLNVCTDNGTPSLGTFREELRSSSPSGFPERISVTLIRRNPPCNSFSTCRNMELILRWVFGMDFRRRGSARWDFPSLTVSSFTGLSYHQKGYGLEKAVVSW